MKNLQPEEFQIPEQFSQFLGFRIKDFAEEKYAQVFEKADWSKVIGDVCKSVNSYWKELSETEKQPIGIFDIRWDEVATEYCIEFDYDLQCNDPKNAMSKGCVYNKPVIDYSKFIKENLKENPEGIWGIMGRDYLVMQDILCRISIEAILFTLKKEFFVSLLKQQPYYLMFAYYHDEKASIIFDSLNSSAIELYPELKKSNSNSNLTDSKNYSDANIVWRYDEERKRLMLPNIEREYKSVPLNFVNFPLTRELALEYHLLKELPEQLLLLKNIYGIVLTGNEFSFIPEILYRCTSLKAIEITTNKLKQFPSMGIPQLEALDVSNNEIKNLKGIGNFISLKTIFARNCSLKSIDKDIQKLTQCEIIDFSNNEIENLPLEMIHMKSLKELRIRGNKITHLPEFLGDMPFLERIEAGGNLIPNENKGRLVQILKQKNPKLQVDFKNDKR